MEKLAQIIFGFLGVLIFINLVFLDVEAVKNKKVVERLVAVEEQLASDEVEKAQVTPLRLSSEGQEDKAIPDPSPTATPKPRVIYSAPMSKAEEVYIPLGSGSTNSTEWINTGAQAYINTDLYSSISAAYFEASLRSNSGGVRARLWQNNEGVAVSGSEVVSSVPASTHKSSGGIGLSGGNKLYIVQVRSETGQEPPLRPRLRRGFEGQARNKKLEEINLR